MQCSDARPLLPLCEYGDLADAERAALDQHLAQCPACRQELAEFGNLRQQLNSLPASLPAVQVAGIYHQESARRQRLARRWRIVAVAAVAAAVVLLFTRLELHLGAQQLVIRWGNREPVANMETPVLAQATVPTPSEP